MSKFKLQNVSVTDENKESSEIQIVKFEKSGFAPTVTSYDLKDLTIRGKGDYSTVKAKYGPLAATDEDRRTKNVKDRRFSVNELLRDPLAIEVEERRVIDRRIQEQVVKEREKARVEGSELGYEDGLKKGMAEGLAQFQAETQGKLEAFQEFVKGFESMKSEIFEANERFLMELVFHVGKMLTMKDLSADPEYVIKLTRELMDTVGIRDNVKIRISQKDAELIDAIKTDLTKTFSDLKNLSIEVSENVKDGGCMIETQWSAIDATVETQLKGIREALVGGSSEA